MFLFLLLGTRNLLPSISWDLYFGERSTLLGWNLHVCQPSNLKCAVNNAIFPLVQIALALRRNGVDIHWRPDGASNVRDLNH